MLFHPLRRSFVILSALVCAWVSPLANAQSAADGFNPTVGGSVDAIVVQPSDSKIIIGGVFSSLQPNGAASPLAINGLARLNVDGTLDTSYVTPAMTNSATSNAAIGAQVLVLALQDDGKLLVGGNFAAGGQNYLARLNTNGSLDTSFAPVLTGNINGEVTAIKYVPGASVGTGQILIGGNFTSVNGTTRNYVARLNYNGSLDANWNPNVNSQVDAFVVQTLNGVTQIILGGAFTTVNPTNSATAPVRNYIARVDNVTGALDPNYNPDANDTVSSMVLLQNGQLLIAGNFTGIAPYLSDGSNPPYTTGFIARLNTDGTYDNTYTTQASANITCMVPEGDGHILIGGSLGTVTNYTNSVVGVSNLARLNYDGSLDTSFMPSLNAPVSAIAVQPNGSIVIGGIFTQIMTTNSPNFVTRRGLARLNSIGTLDTDFNPSAFGGIGQIVVDANGNYLIGGSFTSVDGVTCRNLARLLPSGAIDPTFFKSNPNQPVNAIALQSNGQILIGGEFTGLTSNATSGDVLISHLARLNSDGTQDTSYLPQPNGSVLSIILQTNGQALVGGNFSTFTHNNTDAAVVCTDAARVNTDGTLDLSFMPNPAGTIHSMVLDGTSGYVILAGEFTSETPSSDLIPTTVAYIGRFNLSNGTVDLTWTPAPDDFVYSVVRQSNGQFVYGGVFANVTNEGAAINPVTGIPFLTHRNTLARANANGSLDPNFDPEPDNFVQKVALDTNQNILVCGQFHSINGQVQPYMARLAPGGELDNSMAAQPNAVVDVMTPLANGGFVAGGAFTTMLLPGSTTPVATNHLARFNANGTLDTTLNLVGSLGGTINTMALTPDGKLLVGGSYSNIAGVFAANIARFYNDGSFDNGFGPNPNGPVYAMVEESDGNSLYIGGSFSTISGAVAQNLARVNIDASFDAGFNANPQGTVYVIAPQANGQLIIGGTFASITSIYTTGAVTVSNLARVAGSNGAIDPNFHPTIAGGSVYSAVVQPDGRILIGGSFTSVNGVARAELARLNSDGSLDTSFTPVIGGGAQTSVNGIALQPDGLVVIGGTFTTVGGVAQSYLARLTTTGALDPTLALVPNGPVNAVVLENTNTGNDSIVIGGSFTSVGGTTRNHLARLLSTGPSAAVTLDPNYNPNVDSSPGTTVNTIAFGLDGKSYVGGSFSTVTGLTRLGIARIAATGGSASSISTNSLYNQFTWTLSGQVPEMNDVVFEVSSDGVNFTTLGAGTRVGTSNTWTITDTPAVPSGDIFILALGDSLTSEFGSQSEISFLQHFYGTPVSSVQSSLTPAAVVGTPFYYELGATNNPTSITATGLPPGLTINTALGIISGTPTSAGTYAVTVTIVNANATATVKTITLTVNATSAPANNAGRLLNISTRSTVSQTYDLESGFVITGSSPKTVLLRAIGPALAAFNIGTPLTQPHLTLYNSASQVILNAQGWDGSAAISNIMAQVGAFPLTPGATDTAVVTVLSPGNYTIHVTTGDGNTGTALAEVYDADLNVYTSPSVLSNISSHGLVDGTGDQINGGFVIGGTASRKILIRGIGPGLDFFGLAGLPDPVLTVYSGSLLVAANTNFENQVAYNPNYPVGSASQVISAAATTGAFTLTAGYMDAAVLLTLPPGAYTATITTAGGNTGVAQFEAFDDGTP